MTKLVRSSLLQWITPIKLVKLSLPLNTRRVKKVPTIYTVEEVKGSDATVTYDTMKAVVTVEVRHDGTAKP